MTDFQTDVEAVKAAVEEITLEEAIAIVDRVLFIDEYVVVFYD